MQSSSEKKIKFDISKYVVYIIFVLCIVIFGIWLGGSFFSVTNLLNVVRQSGAIAVMAIEWYLLSAWDILICLSAPW